jgi:hypothetical protein
MLCLSSHVPHACITPQVLLLEVQSATAIYPATVALLLHALSSAQRQQLADTLLDTAQQQLQQQQYLQEPLQVPAWVQQVQQLSKWDVLLLLGLWGQPQWEADAGLVLLQGVSDMARCAAAEGCMLSMFLSQVHALCR